MKLGLDWDGTVSCYTPELSHMAQLASQVFIITVNDEITPQIASNTLSIPLAKVDVYICPDDRVLDYPVWKAEICVELGIDLMIDDDGLVAAACWAVGIPTLHVVERDHASADTLARRLQI